MSIRPVCIIDDDEDVRSIMCFALGFENISVMVLENGKKALDYLSKLPCEELPCLIILDYMMPEMDGIEFIHEVRVSFKETLAKIPLALSSGSQMRDEELPEDIIILSKPIVLADLIKVASAHFGNQVPFSSFLETLPQLPLPPRKATEQSNLKTSQN